MTVNHKIDAQKIADCSMFELQPIWLKIVELSHTHTPVLSPPILPSSPFSFAFKINPMRSRSSRYIAFSGDRLPYGVRTCSIIEAGMKAGHGRLMWGKGSEGWGQGRGWGRGKV